jgi:wyosine [tRNA(Phe)-imidazoG37] synthetase (radical SAM superfamily)
LRKHKSFQLSTFLFQDIIFGPVISRRFGVSLGINLLPSGYKYCTFNCLYCECGWTFKKNAEKSKLPEREDICKNLEYKLAEISRTNLKPDNITFAGNGEPTIHPQFPGIIEDTIRLRDKYFPGTSVTVLSNSTMLHKKKIFDALDKVENNVLKLDTAIESTFQLLNQPYKGITLGPIIENIKKFNGNQIIQTLFIRGRFKGNKIDNTTEEEISAWIKAINEIRPKYVMLYPIHRDTPVSGLEKISGSELEEIAARLDAFKINTKVYN